MFAEFETIDKELSIEVATNGWVLKISGRDKDENWIDRSYLYTDWVLFTTALTALEEKVEGAQHAAR